MLKALFLLTALMAVPYVSADQAITSPSNGTTVQPGQQVDFKWYSDDDDDDNTGLQFDVALVSLIRVS